MSIDEAFFSQLDAALRETFVRSGDVTYLVDDDMRLRGYNEAWTQFALSNNGAAVLESYTLGRSILDGMSPEPRAFYGAANRRALDSVGRFEQSFECSSAHTHRSLHQRAYPLPNRQGLVVTNHLVEERPMDRGGEQPSVVYLSEHGLVVQCCHCRCVKHQTVANRWDWVPSWVEQSPSLTSHTFCPHCFDFYYGDSRRSIQVG